MCIAWCPSVREGWRACCGLWLVAMLFAAQPLAAGEPSQPRITRDAQVVYCHLVWPTDVANLRRMLRSGIAIVVRWELSIKRERRYWLDERLGDVEVVRRVVPDMLSHRWLLEDQGSGITRSVSSLDQAIRFLTRLDAYPVVDRGLLQHGVRYVLDASLQVYEGEAMDNWWNRWLRGTEFATRVVFKEP